MLKLLTGEKDGRKNPDPEDDIKTIRHILETNKHFLTDQYWKDNKIRSILHIVKYSSKAKYDVKQKIINTIVDVGYRSFKFSEGTVHSDKCHALFFVAAKADLKQLEEIVSYFKNHNVSAIHDTREGDTVLSFLVKFGDYFQDDFLNCFNLMLNEGIDVKRVDYFKNNVREIVRKEIEFLKRYKIGGGYIEKLSEIADAINTSARSDQGLDSKINYKYKIFQAIINEDKNLKEILKKDMLDSDDGENTLLQLAIIKNNVEITRELLDKGANPNHVVAGRNEEAPLVLAAKLAREVIFKEILKCKKININKTIFAKFVTELKWKFLSSLLESKYLNVDIEYKGKTPLHYAIIGKNKIAIQSLLQRGSRLHNSHLQNINPNDLEYYLNSCIRFDNYKKDMDEGNYKSFLVFDSFINSPRKTSKDEAVNNPNEVKRLITNSETTVNFDSEVSVIRKIGNTKRLKHLLEHPLVFIYIMLKWHCVLRHYYTFIIAKFIFYIMIDILIYTGSFNYCIIIPVILVQILVVSYNYSEFKFEFRRYTLHFILEIIVLIFLFVIFCLKLINNVSIVNIINQMSAFIIIFTSVSMLLAIGYHLKLSKWMAMAKRVFRNFSILLLFFMVPITAFAASFTLLLSDIEETKNSKNENADFSSFYRALSRTLIMLGGDIGDKKFTSMGSYILFLFFTIGIAIILLNFWTGVAVSDIKEIEEQSTIVAFRNVIEFIESTEMMYKFIFDVTQKILPPQKYDKVLKKIKIPFLKSKICLKRNDKFCYGIEFFINSQKQFKKNNYFEECKIPNYVISKIKALSDDDKDINIPKILQELIEKTKSFDNIMVKLNKIEQLLQNQGNRSQ